jgi:hypothetical protein
LGGMASTYICARCGRTRSKDDNYNPMTGACRICPPEDAPVDGAPSRGAKPAQVNGERGLGGLCTAFGLVLMVLGIYFLLEPGVALEGVSGDVVNLQRLTLGEAFTISGSVFLAAAWRPR